MTPPALLLAYYGDDFTGSTDVLEVLTTAGVPTVLFFETPDAQALLRFPGVRAVGLAGQARGRNPAWMHQHLAPALAALAQLGAPILHYKVCSTFDSSPDIGSIGCAIDIGVPLMPGRWSPMVVGAPRLRRYQAFGHLFAVADGNGFRLDRHPTMARHPVTPMGESDLRRHLGAQTSRRSALIDFTQLKRGAGTAALQSMRDAHDDVPVVLIDVLDDETLCEAGRMVWEHKEEGVFAAASSGLEYALAAHWRATGLLPEPPPMPRARAAGAIAVLSGSCSPVTAAQIAWAQSHGFATHRLDVQRLLGHDGEAEISRAVEAACAGIGQGRSALVFTALGPDDPAVQAFDEAARATGLRRAEAAVRTGEALARVATALLARQPVLRRLVVAGGDSAGAVVSGLGLQALTMVASLAPGAPLCRASARDAVRDGLELVLKGGQMGAVDFFCAARDGVAR